MTASHLTMTFSCIDRPGIVARVAGLIFDRGGSITASSQYGDVETGRFFMRTEFDLPDGAPVDEFRDGFGAIAQSFGMEWQVRDRNHRPKIVVFVSKLDHCIADILYRVGIGELKMDIAAIVSNHPQPARAHFDIGDIPFHYLPVTRETKAEQEGRAFDIVTQSGAELVVLARYMQIFSDAMAARLNGRCINIHHSFLPGFKGAKPYHQAHERGVKLIGATAHYVTGDLDEGPIIEQDVERISHSDTPDDLIRKGRDIERRVLSRAIGFHIDGRVLLNGTKTVVFPD